MDKMLKKAKEVTPGKYTHLNPKMESELSTQDTSQSKSDGKD